MSKAVLQGNASGTGVVTLQTADTNTDMTITLPARAGNLMMDGPAFSAYASGSQSLSSGVLTKLQTNVEVFDTNSNFDNVTNYRFTPTVAGYYQVNGGTLINYSGSNGFLAFCSVYKNGSEYVRGPMYYVATGTSISQGGSVSSVIYLNGSTDYLELYIRADSLSGTRTTETAASPFNYFNGSLVRGA